MRLLVSRARVSSYLAAVGLLALGGAACSTASSDALEETTSLYALVQTIDGVAFYPPLGPDVGAAASPIDTSLLASMSVVLESVGAAGDVAQVATFGAGTSPALQLKPVHQVYFVNVPAAAYFTDASRAYRFRVLSNGVEIARSDLSDRVFSVLASNHELMVGVKVRVEQRPSPIATDLVPSSVVRGTSALALTVRGTSFLHESVVRFGDTALATTFVSAHELVATVPATLLASAGLSSVFVTTPAPGGGTSVPVEFTVHNAAPVLASVSPSRVIAGSGNVVVTLDGAAFASGAEASIGGTALATTFVSPAQLTAVVPASLTAAAGSLSIGVSNPAPSLGASGAVTLLVNNPTPVVSSLSPASVQVGSGAFTLTVNGSSFVSGASVTFGGTALATTWVSATRLTATVGAGLVSTYGSWNVSVTNPSPAEGASGTVAFSTTCATGTHAEGGACTSDTRSCTITNGSGTQTWTGSAWGACTVTSCNTGFILSGGACVAAGTTSGAPGTSCASLYAAGVRTSGAYFINPDNSSSFQAYCNMTTDGGGWTLVMRVVNGYHTTTADVQSTTLPARNTHAKMSDAMIRTLARGGSREAMINDGTTIYILRYSDAEWSTYASNGWTNTAYDSKTSAGVWRNDICNGHYNNRGFSTWNDNPYSVCSVVWAGPTKYMTQYHTYLYSGGVGGIFEVYVR